MATIRIYVERNLELGDVFEVIEKQAHYLINVMKLKIGSKIFCFNNKDGEFEAEISSANKKTLTLELKQKTKDFQKSPDIWLLFAPLKKDQTDYVIQKSTELGARKIIPTITLRTNSEKVRIERFQVQAIEACEQCRRVDIPEISEAISLEKLLQNWDKNRPLFYLDETGGGRTIVETFIENNHIGAILVGPEGGFDKKELELLKNLDYTHALTMGSRIMRAETAVAASLSCWQALCGDWRDNENFNS